jgi:hypothetical protein
MHLGEHTAHALALYLEYAADLTAGEQFERLIRRVFEGNVAQVVLDAMTFIDQTARPRA